MEIRLMRYFVAVAEELHLARAAERLGIEQSPVSRAMHDLERQLNVQLFDRSFRQTRLTGAGQVMLDECRCVLATVDQAIQATKSAAQGYQSCLRIGICDSLAQPRIATLLARSRENEDRQKIRIVEMSFSQQLRGLHNGLLDVGFALSGAVNDGLLAERVWTDPMSVIVPARHLLLAHAQIKLDDALKFPLVLCYPEAAPSCHDQIQATLGSTAAPLEILDRAASLGVMLTLVGAGYGIGLAIASQVQALQRPDIVIRPLAGMPLTLSTFLLRRKGKPSEPLRRFLQRVRREFAEREMPVS